MTRTRTLGAALLLASAAALGLTACTDKASEPYKDAPRTGTNSGPAEVITMPDGFSNAATKCDHGNRIYVVFHNNRAYGAVAVVPNDPTCANASTTTAPATAVPTHA